MESWWAVVDADAETHDAFLGVVLPRVMKRDVFEESAGLEVLAISSAQGTSMDVATLSFCTNFGDVTPSVVFIIGCSSSNRGRNAKLGLEARPPSTWVLATFCIACVVGYKIRVITAK